VKQLIIYLSLVLLLQSCTTIKCSVKKDLLSSEIENVSIKQDVDPINLKKYVVVESQKLGFNTENKNDSLNAYLTYNYIHYFDTFHYTLNIFSIMVVNADTKEVLASAFCTGDSPSGAEGIVGATFSKLGEKIKSIPSK